MPIAEHTALIVHMAQRTKELCCKTERMDLCPTIVVLRGNDPVAVITSGEETLQATVALTGIAAVGYDADIVGLVLETYTSHGTDSPDINPGTGEEWQPGELNDEVFARAALAKGWVREALTVTAANQADDFVFATLPYRYEGNKVVWYETSRLAVNDPDFDGALPRALKKFMGEGGSSSWDRRVGPRLSGLLVRNDRDALTTSGILKNYNCDVRLYADPNDTERIGRLALDGFRPRNYREE